MDEGSTWGTGGIRWGKDGEKILGKTTRIGKSQGQTRNIVQWKLPAIYADDSS